ncbi:hypothetical protein BFW01_g10305 [Lasiodiplodia theobromae]|uniref:Uncharacterized protein n=1 Tax=Lasiodiplodia theobromae TaxID=45133 RepID=A0A8H7IPV1_9PEZI|nr:hypothetical protein BFW01_g10305 [Lasiodiplodia theobromae]
MPEALLAHLSQVSTAASPNLPQTPLLSRFRLAVWSSWVVTCAENDTLIVLDVDTPTCGWEMIFILVGVGRGLILMSLNFAIQAIAEERNAAYVVSMYTFFRSLKMSIGVAISGAVFQNMFQNMLQSHLLP